MSSAAMPAGGGILYDVSRLIARHSERTPTGIDRVDLRYALCALSGEWGPAMLVAQRGGAIVEVPRSVGRRLLAHLVDRWLNGGDGAVIESALQGAGLAGTPPAGKDPVASATAPRQFAMQHQRCVYVNASHHGLADPEPLTKLHSHIGGGCIFYVHDLIPIEFPEHVPHGDKAVHEARMRTVLSLGSTILVNSDATRHSLETWAARNDFPFPRTQVARIGLENSFLAAEPAGAPPLATPYFVCVGTIESRKNHITLLHAWRAMARELPPDEVPTLVLIGRRGWECDHVFALLDRCDLLRPHVIELSGLSDGQMRSWLQGARAALFPTFTEGWGIPVVEALAVGVPVICSDIPVLKEAAQGLGDPVDPLDAPGWRARIMAYAGESAESRDGRRAALSRFVPPSWKDHLVLVRDALFQAMKQGFTADSRSTDALRRLATPEKELPSGSILIPDGLRSDLPDFLSAVAAGDNARDRRDWVAAAYAYRQALHFQPEEAGVWVQYGHMLKEAGNLKAAYEAYCQALKLMPTNADLHLQLGHLFKLADRAQQALAYYEMAAELDRSNTDALHHVEWGRKQLALA